MSHAPFSPSSAHRWLRCPGSALLVAKLPAHLTGLSSPAAMKGTRIHLYAEKMLRRQNPPENADTKELEVAAGFAGHVERLARARKGRTYVFAEERVKIHEECWGTADAIIWAPEELSLDIFDLKSGREPVLPGSPQLRIYGTGAYNNFPSAKFITAWIVQPTVYENPVFERFETWELIGMSRLVQNTVDKAYADTYGSLTVGKWCERCPARLVCPAVTEELKRLIPENLNDDTDYAVDFGL